MKKDSGYLISRTEYDSSGTMPEYDAPRAKKSGSQPRQRRESQYGSPEQDWIKDPDSNLLAGVDCSSSGELENSPDQTFEMPGRSRRRSLLVPRSHQRRMPNFCPLSEPTKGGHVPGPLNLQEGSSGPLTSPSPGIRNSEPSPLDKQETSSVNGESSKEESPLPLDIVGEPNQEVCSYKSTQVPICTLFDSTVEPISVAWVVNPARLCKFFFAISASLFPS